MGEQRCSLYIRCRNQAALQRQAPSVIRTSDRIVCLFKYTSADGSFHGHLNIQGMQDLVPACVTSRVAQVEQFELQPA